MTKDRTMNAIIWFLTFLATGLLVTAVAGVRGAFAQEVGQGLICDTAQQAEEWVAYVEANDQQEVTGCMVAQVAFLRGEEAKAILVKRGQIHITKILVIALVTPMGLMRVPPNEQYTIFLQKLEES